MMIGYLVGQGSVAQTQVFLEEAVDLRAGSVKSVRDSEG